MSKKISRRKVISAGIAGAGLFGLGYLSGRALAQTSYPNIYLDNLPSTASYVISTDGTYYYAVRYDGYLAFGGPNNRGGVSGTDASAVIQAVLNALPNGGKILIKNGFYNLNYVGTHPAIGRPYCLEIHDGIVLEGESMYGTVLYVPAPSSGDGVIITNKNYTKASGGDRIVVRNLTFKGTNVVSGTGYVTWVVGMIFAGVYQSLIENVYGDHASIVVFLPLGDTTNAENQTYAGKNYGNVVRNCIGRNGVGSNGGFWLIDTYFINDEFYDWGDDVILVARWAKNVNIINCVFDGSNHELIGSSTGQVSAGTDAASPNPNDPRMVEVNIYNSIFRANIQNSGQRAGIAGNSGTTIRVYNSLIENQPCTSGPLSSEGGGIVSLGILTVKNCIIRNNQGNGILFAPYATSSIASALEDAVIEGNEIYNNNQSATANLGGLKFITAAYPSGSIVPFDVVIRGNRFFDNQSTPTQNNGIVLFIGVELTLKTYIENNSFVGQPGNAIYVQLGSLSPSNGIARVIKNQGYNPPQPSIVSVAANATTTIGPYLYDVQVILSAPGNATGVSLTRAGTSTALPIQSSYMLYAGDTLSITEGATAQTAYVVPL
jgi:hypothetical protein